MAAAQRYLLAFSCSRVEIAQGLKAGVSGFMGEYRYSAVQQSDVAVRCVFLARMDEGVAGFAKEQVELSSLVRDAAQSFEQVAEQRGKRFHVSIESNVQVKGDAAALSQVVELLLDNATSYAKDGTQIELSLKRHGVKAQLSVSNEVERMPEGDLDRLFERFYRGDSSRSSQTGGSGRVFLWRVP